MRKVKTRCVRCSKRVLTTAPEDPRIRVVYAYCPRCIRAIRLVRTALPRPA